MASDPEEQKLSKRDLERAKYVFEIFDLECNDQMDTYYLDDALRALNFIPTKAYVEKLGGTLRKGEPLGDEDVDLLIKECCDQEDEDGCISYESFLKRVCVGPHEEFYGTI